VLSSYGSTVFNVYSPTAVVQCAPWHVVGQAQLADAGGVQHVGGGDVRHGEVVRGAPRAPV
jgi:hypothetical protein